MDSTVILRIMRDDPKTRRVFGGVYAVDEYVYIPQYKAKCAYIINTGKKGTAGIHWVAIFYNGCDIYYFDSLALSPLLYSDIYKTILRFNPRRVFTMPFRIQGLSSSVCGHYCINFISHMVSRKSFFSYISKFSPYDMSSNDISVCHWIASLYPYASNYCYAWKY